jgi:HlyD family secretion protein
LVQRDPIAEQQLAANADKPGSKTAVPTASAASSKTKPVLVQGVYILKTDHKKERALFIPVTTGITGATDIEVLTGISPGQTIVTGLYRVLRTLKSGTAVKADNSASNVEVPKS